MSASGSEKKTNIWHAPFIVTVIALAIVAAGFIYY